MRRLSDGKVFSWDHKSTSGKYINNDSWANQFYLSIQNGTYTHCLYCQYPIEDVLGIEFCGQALNISAEDLRIAVQDTMLHLEESLRLRLLTK
jgi:hypothetical protein